MFDKRIKAAAYVSLGLCVAGVSARVYANAGAALLPDPAIMTFEAFPVAGTAMVQSHAGFPASPPNGPVDPETFDVRIGRSLPG